MEFTWTFTQPAKLTSINELNGRSWQVAQQTKRYWLDAGWAHGLEMATELRKREVITPLTVPVTIQFDFEVRDDRRRDGHNYAGTVCKWFIDGLVTAKVLRDDSSDWLALADTTFTVIRRARREMTVTLSYEESIDEQQPL